MTLTEKNSAVVLIEFQNQWTEKGLYHRLIKKQLEANGIIGNTKAFVEESRKRGLTIIHAPLVIDPANKKGWLAYLTFGKVFTKGTWKAEIPTDFLKEDDLVVTGRYAFDAFTGSDLKQLLEQKGIKNIFLCGFTTDQCISKTMETALHQGLNCFLVSDCTATFCNWLQKRTEADAAGHISDYQQILNMIR